MPDPRPAADRTLAIALTVIALDLPTAPAAGELAYAREASSR